MTLQTEAREFRFHAECLNHVLKRKQATQLIVCCSQEQFLEKLTIEASSIPHDEEAYQNGGNEFSAKRLLNPTIRLLAQARYIHIAFAPSLAHFRAYVISLLLQARSENGSPKSLIILGLIASHRATSEFSAQGLSRTLALALEVATSMYESLQFIESWKLPDVQSEPEDSASVFRERVPILSGSLRDPVGDRVWTGRTIGVGFVFQKWCKIVRSM